MIDPNEALRQLKNANTDLKGLGIGLDANERKWMRHGIDIMYDNAKDIIECLGKIGRYAPKEEETEE